jgi:hypothetical protein
LLILASKLSARILDGRGHCRDGADREGTAQSHRRSCAHWPMWFAHLVITQKRTSCLRAGQGLRHQPIRGRALATKAHLARR